MRKTLFASCLLIISGCATNHYSDATLYRQSSGNIYDIPETGNNPIYVDNDSVFSIEIDYMQPGWIHNGESMPALDDTNYEGFSQSITSHLYGKELWLLTKIESLSYEDVLERNSKTYYKTTSIKLNSESFAKIALDDSEKSVFAHAADSQYRISFKLYEIQGFSIKKAAVRAYDDSPGLAGIFLTIGQTISSTLGSLAGSIITDLWKSASEEQLFTERLLLENGGTLEFKGIIHVLRKNGVLKAGVPLMDENYILYDKFKSDSWDTAYSNKETYISKKQEKDQSVDISTPAGAAIDSKTYIKLKVTQGLSDQAATQRGIAFLTGTHRLFLNSVKID